LAPDGSVEFANAGHTTPYVICDANSSTPNLEVLLVRSNPLGSYRPYIASGNYQLCNGDIVVLTSDGLTDRISQAGTRFGEKRLRKTLMDEATRGKPNVRTLCERIVDEVNVFGGEQPVDDDITLVIVQYTGAATGSRRTSKKGAAA